MIWAYAFTEKLELRTAKANAWGKMGREPDPEVPALRKFLCPFLLRISWNRDVTGLARIGYTWVWMLLQKSENADSPSLLPIWIPFPCLTESVLPIFPSNCLKPIRLQELHCRVGKRDKILPLWAREKGKIILKFHLNLIRCLFGC